MENNDKEITAVDLDEKDGINYLDEVLDWCESFVFAIFIVIFVFTFLFRIVQVDGPSMNDTLNDGDRLILTHFNYEPAKGDIVVLNSDGLNKTIIKRVIATAGDTISIDFSEGIVTLNGQVLEEGYIKNLTTLDEGTDITNLTIGDGEIFVMGDNRQNSTDSRDSRVGIVSTDDVLGKAVFRIFPFDSIGSVYD